MLYQRDKLLQDLKSAVCEVTFTKVNGETRVMRCTLDPRYIPQQINEKHLDDQHRKPENLDVIACWDVNANGWRSFRIENVQYVQEINTF